MFRITLEHPYGALGQAKVIRNAQNRPIRFWTKYPEIHGWQIAEIVVSIHNFKSIFLRAQSELFAQIWTAD